MMSALIKKTKRILRTLYLPAIVVIINLLIIFFPKDSIAAAREGLALWFENVLPSLLPFLIGTNLLMSLGFVNFLGVLLEPIMRPIFGVPGSGGFGLAVGFLSGYPMGAKVTASLKQRNELTKREGERLLSFVNNSGPLFVLGAVASGMFMSVGAGYFLLSVHYLAAITTGLLFRAFYKIPRSANANGGDRHIFRKAYRSMRESNNADQRPFGAKLGESVAKGMETVVQIGGFIILFCVITRILELTNIFYVLETCTAPISNAMGLPEGISKGVFIGLIEMTNGIKSLSENGLTSHALIAAAGVISWGGLSIHAQALSFLSKTDISTGIYFVAKLINAALAVVIGVIIYPLFELGIKTSEAVPAVNIYEGSVVDRLLCSATYFILMPVIIIGIGIGIVIVRKVLRAIKSKNKFC